MTTKTLSTLYIKKLIQSRKTRTRLSPQEIIKKHGLDKEATPTQNITSEIDTIVYGI